MSKTTDDSIMLTIVADSSNHFSIMHPPLYLFDDQSYQANFNNQIVPGLVKKWECALVSCSFTYLIHNITEALQNNHFKYTIESVEYDITIPDGMYSIQTLNEFIQEQMKEEGHYIPRDPDNQIYQDDYYVKLLPFIPSGRTKIVVSDYLESVDLGGLNKLLGITASILSAGVYFGNLPPKFNEGVDVIQIRTPDLVTRSSYINGVEASCIYSFNPNAPASTELVIVPDQRIYFEVSSSRPITNMSVKMTNLDGVPIKLHSQIKYVFHLRRVSH